MVKKIELHARVCTHYCFVLMSKNKIYRLANYEDYRKYIQKQGCIHHLPLQYDHETGTAT